MQTLYGLYFDLYSKTGKFLRAGTIYSNTLSQAKINNNSVFWLLCGKDSAGTVRIENASFDTVEKSKKVSDKYSLQFDEYEIRYYYVKTRG